MEIELSISCGLLVDSICFFYVTLLMQQLKGWKFDEIEGISSSTEKRNSYSHNLIVNKGETDKKKMISNTNKGHYITEIEQIRSDLKSGRMFIKASGNWINFGEISYPVENIFISNDSIRVLRNIVEISDDLQIMGRINSPTFKISEMEIKNQL